VKVLRTYTSNQQLHAESIQLLVGILEIIRTDTWKFNMKLTIPGVSSNDFQCILFLAHLSKGNVSFCHHMASVVRRPLTFHILIFSSETPKPNELKLENF
jgi:hypothetical protein